MYANLTTQNSSFLKRFSHVSRFQIAVKLIDPASRDFILDYGTGDGYLLKRLRLANNRCRIIGYEPDAHMFKELLNKLNSDKDLEEIEVINNLRDLHIKYNKICCLEVLEHLTEENQKKEIKKMMRLLTDSGDILISVPIEVGLPSLLKNIVRLLLHQTHEGATFKNILCSLFYVKLHRGKEPYISSHIGFNYNDLEKTLLSSGLKITKKIFSPIPTLKGFINSQVFFVVEKI